MNNHPPAGDSFGVDPPRKQEAVSEEEESSVPVIAAVVGSLRAKSFNRSVFEATRAILAGRAELVEASIAEVPLFNEDVEVVGDPEPVMRLKAAVEAADGLIFFTAEYNRSMPAATKNAVDWLSRPFLAGPIAGAPVGIVAASPGPGDAAGSRAHLSQAAAGAGGTVHDLSLGIAGVADAFTDGELTDEAARTAIADWAEGFLAFVAETNAPPTEPPRE